MAVRNASRVGLAGLAMLFVGLAALVLAPALGPAWPVAAAGHGGPAAAVQQATNEPSPTAVGTVTPRPTPNPMSLIGKLRIKNPTDPCRHDALLSECFTGSQLLIRSDTDLSGLIDYDVRIEGVTMACESGSGTYFQVQTIGVLPSGCGPTPTPPPTPTALPNEDLAHNAPVTVRDELPGFPGTNVNDGDLNTSWRSDRGATWIYLDLGKGQAVNRTFNQVVLEWGATYATRYAMYTWENGTWSGFYQTLGDADGGQDKISLPRIYSRFVLLYLLESSAPGGGYDLHEWQIYGRETPNQALGGAVEVNSAQPGQPGYLANDGNYDTFWASVPFYGDPWIRVRLPGTYIAEVRLYWAENLWPRRCAAVFYDGATQKGVGITLKSRENKFGPPSPIRSDAFLLYCYGSDLPSTGYVALEELELYELSAVHAARQVSTAGVQVTTDWTAAPGPWPPGDPVSGAISRLLNLSR
jgi:hypothetical protein